MLHCMGFAELAHYRYNLPVWGFSGCSDSKLPEMQAGIESTLWILWTALSGANLVHDIGYVESGLTCSYEMIVVCDEIISFVRRLMRGVEITPETMALDVIHQVRHTAGYLKQRHTREHSRRHWYPRLLDRRAHQAWSDAGRPTALESARALAREILATHAAPPIPDSTLADLRAVIAGADARAGIEAPKAS